MSFIARRARLVWLLLLGACASQPSSPPQHPSQTEVGPKWVDWSGSAFTQAAQEHKLVLLSVQAGWCHWCHVMNATTYKDPALVAFLEAHFVTIRVEQDSRPDLAQRYLRWGWPATALLNSDGTAIINLRGHQPSGRLLPLLQSLVSELSAAGHVASRMDRAPEAPPVGDLSRARDLALAQLDATYDEKNGGWGVPQKYPLADPVEHALLRAQLLSEPTRLEHVRASLTGYAKLIDPVAGGAYQYSTHSHWDSPHFEKIAKVQAGAIRAFSLAHRLLGDEVYLDHARRVASYVASTFSSPQGAFYTSQDADVGAPGAADHIDGHRYYAAAAADRAQMSAPTVDTHVYADLNGMLISALADLARQEPGGPWLGVAQRALSEIIKTHVVGDEVHHDASTRSPMRYLSDHVEVVQAMAKVAELTMDGQLLASSDALLSATVARFRDPVGDGFFAHTEDASAVGIYADRLKPYEDNALLARLLLRMGRRTHDQHAIESATQALLALASPSGIAAQQRRIAGYLIAATEALSPFVVARVVGPAADAETRALYDAVLALPTASILVVQEAPEESDYPFPGKPTLYLCSEDACSAPIQQADGLSAAYQAFTQP